MLERTSCLLLALAVLAGCGKLDQAADDAADEAPDPEAIKSEVVDKLDCSGIAREETRDLVGNAIDGEADLDRLATSPGRLSRMVAGAAATTDATALIIGNATSIARHGHMKTAIRDGWGDLECGDTRTFQCTDMLSGESQGEGSTSVTCDGGEPNAIEADFSEGCRLFGTENSGAVTLARDGTMQFDGLQLGTVKRLEGKLGLETQYGEVRRVEVATGEKLTVTSNAGKSCEQTTIVRELVGEERDRESTLDFDVTRDSGDKSVTTRTLADPVTYEKPVDCSCPTEGTVELTSTDPVGLGEKGTLLVDYAPADGETCGRADVSVETWPEGCEESDACGRQVVERLAGDLITASCVGLQ